MPELATTIPDPVADILDESDSVHLGVLQSTGEDVLDDESDDERTDPLASSSDAELHLEDFTNVYFSLSPPVQVRMLNGLWYTLPWQVFQSLKVSLDRESLRAPVC